MKILTIGFPAANSRAWINSKEWHDFPNLPSGPSQDETPIIPPEPEPEPIIQFNFLYKKEGDIEWREYEPAANDIQVIDGQVTITAVDFKNIEDFDDIKEMQLPNKWNNGSENVDVTCIGYQAFDNCNGLSHVIILDGITKIDTAAFNNCSNLISVVIPNSTHIVNNNAFYSTPFYDSQPDGLTIFGKTAYGIKGAILSSVEIPDGITHINQYAFSRCGASLETVLLPDSLIDIGLGAFDTCTSLVLNDIPTIPVNVVNIDKYAFSGCASLTKLIIPNKVINIDKYAFAGCTSLTLVMFGNSVKNIGTEAFYGCIKLNTIIIPDSVTNIGNNAFYNCRNLTRVIILANGGNAEVVKQLIITAINSSDISDNIDWDVPVNVSNGKVLYQTSTSADLNEDDAQIENGEFIGFSQIKFAAKIFLPTADIDGNNITSISQTAFRAVFSSSKLKYVVIPKNIISIGNITFSTCTAITTVLMLGRTMKYVKEMTNYPWSLRSNCQIICLDGIITI